MTAMQFVGPTDAQLAYLRSLCFERGLPMPPVASKVEASLVIDEIIERRYRSFEDDPRDEAVPF